MCFFFSLVPATVFVTLGYFVLFSSTKVDGPVRTFGRVLAVWVFLLALLFPTMGAYVTATDVCPFPRVLQQMR